MIDRVNAVQFMHPAESQEYANTATIPPILIVVGFSLWYINIDPGSHQGWKTSFH